MVQHIYCNYKSTAKAVFFFAEQRFEKCLRFEETAKQDNPHLLRVGALKIYCERKQTAKAVFFYEAAFQESIVHGLIIFFLHTHYIWCYHNIYSFMIKEKL